jgi:hypothetical protein
MKAHDDGAVVIVMHCTDDYARRSVVICWLSWFKPV